MRIRLLATCLTLSLMACGVEEPETWREPEADTFLTSTQDIREALGALPGVEVLGTYEDGVPLMIRGELGMVQRSLRTADVADAHAQVGAALARVAPVFRLSASDLVPRRILQDELGQTHLRYEQRRNGLPVVGHELILHVDAEGRIFLANGSARDGEDVLAPSQARVSAGTAIDAALSATPGGTSTRDDPRLVYVRSSGDQRLKLAFEVVVLGAQGDEPIQDHVFIDAGDGTVVERISDIRHALNRRVYSANNTTVLPGTLRRSEGQAPTGDAVVDKAYDNLGTFYNCYYTLFGLDSYNGAGAMLSTTVHYGNNYVNAFWDGSRLVCGDGNGVQSGPLCNDPDVIVHEFTHAVTDYSSGLVSSGQSGGLDESYSDIFSAVCESWTRSWAMDADVWKIGEDIWTPPIWGDALRYMNDPKQDGASLDCISDWTSSTPVHHSAGIPSLAFQLLAQGGTHPRARTALLVPVPGIGAEKAGRIFYRASRFYMTAATNFAGAKTATEQAAMDLYGATDKGKVTKAWQAVGVGATTTPACLAPPTLLPNGVELTGISGALGSWTSYAVDVPPCAANLRVEISGGMGDADLYVKAGSGNALNSWDCRPYLNGNVETCDFATPAAGKYYIVLHGYAAYSGVTLKVNFDGVTMLSGPTSMTGLSGALDSQQVWAYNAAPNKTVQTQIFPGALTTGNADLYVRFGARPTLAAYDCRPYSGGSGEICSDNRPTAGTYCIMVHGRTAYSEVGLMVEEM